MRTKVNTEHAPIKIVSLETLDIRKQQLRDDLNKSEEQLADLWNVMFRQPSEEELGSPTKRLLATITSASAVIDGALLGWKLYRRLGGTVNLFRKRKK